MDKNGKRRELNDELHRRVEELSRDVGISPRELVREAVEAFAASRMPRRARDNETALAKRLRAIRTKIVRSGTPLLDATDIDRELAEGRRQRES